MQLQRDWRRSARFALVWTVVLIAAVTLVLLIHRYLLGEAIADTTGNCSWYVFVSEPEGEATLFDSDPYEHTFSCGEQNEQISLDAGEARNVELPGTNCVMRVRYANSPSEPEHVAVSLLDDDRGQSGEPGALYCMLDVVENGEGGYEYTDDWFGWSPRSTEMTDFYEEHGYRVEGKYVDNGIAARLCELNPRTWQDTPCYTITIEI